MRHYGFATSEIVDETWPNLDLDIDPKLSWALRNRQDFPIDVHTATRETLLRVPGLGVKNVDRILSIRRFAKLRLADLARLRVPLEKVRPFVILADHRPSLLELDSDQLRSRFTPKPIQLELFDQ